MNNGTKSILDRISNLISEDSSVLANFNKKINTANNNKSKAEEEKKKYESEITGIQSDIDEISRASELSDRFSNLESYIPGLEKLGKSVSLLNSLKEELDKIPEQIESLENEIRDLTEKSDDRAKAIEKANDELSKLDVELSDAKRYQENLIELVNLAKSGNINKTREEVVETLIHVGFTDKEAVSAAKVILFPEDDLIPYFIKSFEKNDYAEDTTNELVEETSTEEVENETTENISVEENNEESESETTEVVSNEDNSEEEIEETTDEISEDDNSVKEEINDTTEEISLDEAVSEITLDSMDDDEKLKPVDVASDNSFDTIKKMLVDFGFDSSKFNNEDIEADQDIIRNNINFILEKNINKEFIYEYPSIISDKYLKAKYEYILNELNKSDEDILLTPEILVSYTKDDLEKLIEVSNQTGVDPKLIPLSVYLKGLQPFLRNYIVLKDNNIQLDNDAIAKFAVILSINPVDFKKSLQVLLDYNISLLKSDGKYALMNLAVKDSELANKIDMIINANEEDLLKFYPEVLSTDVKELVNRIIFLRNSKIPYKTENHNKVIYQSFVLKQEMLDKVLEKNVEIDEVLDKDETNNNLKEIIKNNDIVDELDSINDNFELISNNYVEDYKDVLKDIKGKYKETDYSYIIGDYRFSKNKVNRDINYLLGTFTDVNKAIILASSLLHDSRLSKEDMEKVINLLNIKVK